MQEKQGSYDDQSMLVTPTEMSPEVMVRKINQIVVDYGFAGIKSIHIVGPDGASVEWSDGLLTVKTRFFE